MCFMRKIIKKLLSLLLVMATLLTLSVPSVHAASSDASAVGALWDGFKATTGTFKVTDSSRVFVPGNAPEGDLLQTAQLIQRELNANFGDGYFTEIVYGDISFAQQGDIILQLLTTSNEIQADGYEINVTSDTTVITAKDTDGLIYGANNLIKCFRATNSNTICCFSGYDNPDTKERTVHLDSGRKYYTAEWICNFIRQMSWMGYNALQIHVSEDGGFRGDFWDPDYYAGSFRPENDFTWLCGSKTQTWVKNGNAYSSNYPYQNDPDAGKYLTTAELVKICEVAKEYHIEIIPSFDSPAHMDYITWKFEQNYLANPNYSFKYNGQTFYASTNDGCINFTNKTGYDVPEWPQYSAIDITDGSMAKAFVFALYEDIADFFRVYAGSTKFNIGADEVNLTDYTKDNPRTWSISQFPGYVNELNRLLNGKGYTVRMFNDFMGSFSGALSFFDKNIEVTFWDSPFDPNENTYSERATVNDFISDNRVIYNCIQTHTYYVLRVANFAGAVTEHCDARDPENRQWTFYHSTEDRIYNEWSPFNCSEIGDYAEETPDIPTDQLGGAYFLIWNDYASLNTQDEVWYGAKDNTGYSNNYFSLFDRMASNSIKMWNADINKNVQYATFASARDMFGYFPGFVAASDAAELPDAADPQEAKKPVDRSQLSFLISEADGLDQGRYTAASWSAFADALNQAKSVYQDDNATQEQIDESVKVLEHTIAALEEVPYDTTNEITIRKVTNITPVGKRVGFVVIGSANTVNMDLQVLLNGEKVNLTKIVSNVQNLNGTPVRVWMVNFRADVAGEFTYTVKIADIAQKTIDVTVK